FIANKTYQLTMERFIVSEWILGEDHSNSLVVVTIGILVMRTSLSFATTIYVERFVRPPYEEKPMVYIYLVDSNFAR
ncbi:hypothetical protein, partial [Enterobacter cloacae complex sp. GF14B]|uniref:hypothetical protein n=1 Tax=Enterobacter cloacae complex sp. GF14B TaxID=2511982 RepID=UPI001027F0C9